MNTRIVALAALAALVGLALAVRDPDQLVEAPPPHLDITRSAPATPATPLVLQGHASGTITVFPGPAGSCLSMDNNGVLSSAAACGSSEGTSAQITRNPR